MPDYNLKWKLGFFCSCSPRDNAKCKNCAMGKLGNSSSSQGSGDRSTLTLQARLLRLLAAEAATQQQCPTGGKLQSAFLDFVAPALPWFQQLSATRATQVLQLK